MTERKNTNYRGEKTKLMTCSSDADAQGEREGRRREEVLSVSWEFPQQPHSMAAITKGLVQVSTEPGQTRYLIKEDSFKPSLKCRKCLCLLNPNRELIAQERSLTAEDSASHSAQENSRNHK